MQSGSATPNRPKLKTSVYLELLAVALLLGLNAWLLFKMGSWAELKPDPKPGLLTMIGGMVGMMMVVLGMHELGHLLTGLMQGFQFTIFVVGPLGIKREAGRIKVYLNTNLMLAGGIAGTAPVNDSPTNGDRFRRILIAGPMMSLVLSAACFWLAKRVGNNSTFPAGFFLFATGLTSITIFLATTVPSKSGVFFTDRKRYQRLMLPGKARDVELALLRVMGGFQQHESYRHVAMADIQKLIGADEPINRLLGHFSLVCQQVEANKQIDPQAESDYRAAAKQVSPALAKAYDAELEKYKKTLLTSATAAPAN